MKEELLLKLKNELERIKSENIEHNEKVRRIKELKKDSNVKEYLKLTGLSDELKLIKISDNDIIDSFYRRYIYDIQQEETNSIYIYLGTYSRATDCDIMHGPNDPRVEYNSSLADYRLYRDIEQTDSKRIPILKCEEFEKEYLIINPKAYLKDHAYYEIQKEFFTKAIKTSQQNAKRYILRKYDRLGK